MQHPTEPAQWKRREDALLVITVPYPFPTNPLPLLELDQRLGYRLKHLCASHFFHHWHYYLLGVLLSAFVHLASRLLFYSFNHSKAIIYITVHIIWTSQFCILLLWFPLVPVTLTVQSKWIAVHVLNQNVTDCNNYDHVLWNCFAMLFWCPEFESLPLKNWAPKQRNKTVQRKAGKYPTSCFSPFNC